MNLHCIYRISDAGYTKVKPDYINNEDCLQNFLFRFGIDNLTVMADNVSEETERMLISTVPEKKIHHISAGSSGASFVKALNLALELPKDDYVYFIENDYLHKPGAKSVLMEGLLMGSSFVTLYDHPDKYLDPSKGGNPLCTGDAEDTRVYLTESCHWKITNSTTMTFASKVETLKRTEDIIRKHTSETYPQDFKMFMDLRSRGELLVSSIPGYSTHGETAWLSPLTDWETV